MRIGRWGEGSARRLIISAGLIPVRTNWRAHRGEADIIAFDHSSLVVLEVKTRHISLKRNFAAIRAVDAYKRRTLAKALHAFRRNNGPLLRRYAIRQSRLDAIEVYYSRTRFGFLRLEESRWHRGTALDVL